MGCLWCEQFTCYRDYTAVRHCNCLSMVRLCACCCVTVTVLIGCCRQHLDAKTHASSRLFSHHGMPCQECVVTDGVSKHQT